MKKLFVLFFASFVSLSLSAQSADKVSDVIAAKKATYGQASYLIAAACGLIKNEAGYEESFEMMKKAGAIPSSVNSEDGISMKNFAWLCSFAWKIDGSLMLKIFKSPRYVFRQMKSDEVIPYSVDPQEVPDGRQLLAVLTDCMEFYEPKAREDK